MYFDIFVVKTLDMLIAFSPNLLWCTYTAMKYSKSCQRACMCVCECVCRCMSMCACLLAEVYNAHTQLEIYF